jgi:hypothetical protein
MPDDDRFPRSLIGHWRRVLKAFQAGEPPEAIEYHVTRATAETLRRVHGVPDLPALAAELHRASDSSFASSDGMRTLRLPSHIPTRLAERAVEVLSIVLKDRLVLASPEDASLALAHRIVADVAYSFGLDRIAPVLIQAGQDPAELNIRFQAATRSNPLGELARRLLAHPDGVGLRTPARPRSRVTTADLLDADIMALP